MNYYAKKQLRKTSTEVGLYVFASSVLMTIIVLNTYAFGLFPANFTANNTFMLLFDIIISLVCFFVVGLLYCLISSTPLSSVLPFKKAGASLTLELVLVTVGLSVIASYLADILVTNFSFFRVENTVSFETSSSTPVEDILNIVSISIIPPIAEEFMFRGIILNKLRPYGDALAIVISSVLFSILHGNIVQIPFTFPVGLALAFITVKTDSLLPAIISHFVINFMSALPSVLESNGTFDENTLSTVFFISRFVIIALGIIAAYLLSKRKGFFSLKSNKDFPLKKSIIASLTSVGIILAILMQIAEIISNLRIF